MAGTATTHERLYPCAVTAMGRIVARCIIASMDPEAEAVLCVLMVTTPTLAGELLDGQSAREMVAPDWHCLNLVGLAHLLRAVCRDSLRTGKSQFDDGHLTGLGLTVGPSGQPGRIPNHGSYIGRSTLRQRRRFSHLPSRETLHSTISVVTAAGTTSGHLYSHGPCCLVGLSTRPRLWGVLSWSTLDM